MYLTYASRMMEYRQDGYDAGLTTGRKEGISIGLERGAYQTKLETARHLLTMDLSLEQIMQATSLPLETIQELMQEV